jgi:hypothetical protein
LQKVYFFIRREVMKKEITRRKEDIIEDIVHLVEKGFSLEEVKELFKEGVSGGIPVSLFEKLFLPKERSP